MERKIKVTSEFDNKFIQMATESSDIFNCLTILSDKITEIESPSDLTLNQLNEISALTNVIKSFTKRYSDLVNNSYMLTYCGEE